MRTFKDKHGREWVLELDVPTIERLELRISGFKVDGMLEQNGVYSLFDKPREFVRVLWVLCESQAKAADISPEQFGEGLSRSALDDAGDAFMWALADFTPRHRRPTVAAVVARTKEIEAEANRVGVERVNAVPLSALVTSAAGSSGSSPAPPG